MNTQFEWDDDKVIDFTNWYINIHGLGTRYELENLEILNSFKNGDSIDEWNTTLVIHPKDPTTDFLSDIYKGRNWTIINEDISTDELINNILNHKRIIMMGHGTPNGLLGHNKFIINNTLISLLKNKKCVFIWCNADHFVNKYSLEGIYTGMIISEIEEAIICGIETTEKDIQTSNYLFANAIKESLNIANNEEAVNNIKQLYNSSTNKIIKYNRKRIFYKNIWF